MLKFDPSIKNLLNEVPEPPTERHTKEEILQWVTETHALLAKVRDVLLELTANALLIIGDPED